MAVSGYVVVTALMIGLGFLITDLLESGPIGRGDADATSWLADHRTAGLDGLTKLVSLSADTMGAISIALVVAVVLAIGRRWQAIAALVVGLVLELLVFLTANYVVGRPRPDVQQLGSEPSTSSFPSGHTAATMVIYLLVAVVVTASTARLIWRALAWTAVVVMPAAVGFARVYRGMHHPTDVLAGALMGVAVLAVALVAVRAAKAASAPAHAEIDASRGARGSRPRRSPRGHGLMGAPVAVVAHQQKVLGGGLPELRRQLASAGIEDPAWFEVPKSKKAPKRVRRRRRGGRPPVRVGRRRDGAALHRCHRRHDVTLAILPAGTANLLATNLGIPHDLEGALESASEAAIGRWTWRPSTASTSRSCRAWASTRR